MSNKSIITDFTRLSLRGVERVIRDVLVTSNSSMKEVVNYLLQLKGKRLRPLLVILAFSLVDNNPDSHKQKDLLDGAAAVELIHTASLLHDDIIDGAARRRGFEALHCLRGCAQATLAGNFLLSRAFFLISNLEEKERLLPPLAETVFNLCRGEINQLEKRFHWEVGEGEYYHYNYLKTSQFIAVCCETGARIAGGDNFQISSLREYGFNLGQAFQIADDILDYAEGPKSTGKSTGIDLQYGVVTLPIIYTLAREMTFRKMLQLISRKKSLPAGVYERIYRRVRAGGALKYSFHQAAGFIEDALSALENFPAVPARNNLRMIAERVTEKISPVLRKEGNGFFRQIDPADGT